MKTNKYIRIPLTKAQINAAKHMLKLRSSVQWNVVPCTPEDEQGVTADVMRESKRVGRRGKRRTVTRSKHEAQVINCAQIMAKGKKLKTWLLCPLTGKTRVNVWSAPQGWTIIDNIPLALVADDDPFCDWHIDRFEIISFFERCKKGANEWMELARYNAAKRREVEKQWEEHRAELEKQAAQQRHLLSFFEADTHRTTRVTLQDSRRAGNCVVGSLDFAKRYQLSEEHVTGLNCPGMRGDVLMRSGDYRAKNAVLEAWQRETLVSI